MLIQILKLNKIGVAILYFIMIFQYTIYACSIKVMGWALDCAMLDKIYWPTFIYVAFLGTALSLHLVHDMLDSRVFGHIWRYQVLRTIRKVFHETDKTITIKNLVETFIKFLSQYTYYGVMGIINIIVGVIMIVNCVDYHILITIFSLAIISMMFTLFATKQYEKNEKIKQDHIATNNTHIINNNFKDLKVGYLDIVRCQIKCSDWQAFGNTGNDMCGWICEIIIIYVGIMSGLTTGDIIVNTVYVWKIFQSTSTLQRFFIHYKEVKVAENKIKECINNN